MVRESGMRASDLSRNVRTEARRDIYTPQYTWSAVTATFQSVTPALRRVHFTTARAVERWIPAQGRDDVWGNGERSVMPRNPAATRTRIYAAAYALFYRKGFQRTSLDDIAAKAGLTKRTLYYHVRSKDDLAGAMLAHQHGFVLDEMARWMGEAATPRRLVDQLFDSVARWMATASKRHWTG